MITVRDKLISNLLKRYRGLLLISFFLVPFTFLSMYVDFYWRGKEGLIGYMFVWVLLSIIFLIQNSIKQMFFLNLYILFKLICVYFGLLTGCRLLFQTIFIKYDNGNRLNVLVNTSDLDCGS
jgi:hypothetical protein